MLRGEDEGLNGAIYYYLDGAYLPEDWEDSILKISDNHCMLGDERVNAPEYHITKKAYMAKLGDAYKSWVDSTSNARVDAKSVLITDKPIVTFDYQDGREPVLVYASDFGGTVERPEDPTREGYEFNDWFNSLVEPTSVFDFNKPLVEDKTAYATWTANSYEVSFDSNGGDTEAVPASIAETFDANYVLPTTNPTKAGSTFAGWFTEAEGGEQITAVSIVKTANEHTLYAHWVSDPVPPTPDPEPQPQPGENVNATPQTGDTVVPFVALFIVVATAFYVLARKKYSN